MKKSIILALASFAVALGFVGCKDVTSDGLTGITYYASIELIGDAVCYADLGETYVDEGCVCLLEGEEVEATVTSTVDSNNAGIYSVTYSYTNEDGFTSSTSRTVYMSAPGGAICDAAYLTVQPGTYREYYSDSTTTTAFSGYSIFFLHLGDDQYYVSCLIGAYYEQGVGYGSNYAMQGYIQLNADNSIEFLDGYVSSWGDSYDDYHNASYDPATGVVSWETDYAGCMTFFVKMAL
ncbi:MAG: BT_2262 family domain-containing protein [Rikenellaceae bacterium]